MKAIARLVLLLPVAAFLVGAATADPLAPAREGKLQCYSPDRARKTCQSMASYSFDGGQIRNPAVVLVAKQPVIVMKSTTTVTVSGNAVCGVLRLSDLADATFTINGNPAAEDQAERLKQQLGAALAADMDKEVCTRYEPTGDHLTAKPTVDGKPRPDLEQPVIWVDPDAGYTVAP